MPQGGPTKNCKNNQKQTKPQKTRPNLMDIKKQTVEGVPGRPYQKPPKPLSTNSQHHKKTPPNLREISGKLQGCSRGGLYQKLPKPLTQPKTTKTTKTIKHHEIWWRLTEVVGGAPGGPTKNNKKQPKNKQNHHNHQIWWKSQEMVGCAPGGPYQKPRKPLSKNIQIK